MSAPNWKQFKSTGSCRSVCSGKFVKNNEFNPMFHNKLYHHYSLPIYEINRVLIVTVELQEALKFTENKETLLKFTPKDLIISMCLQNFISRISSQFGIYSTCHLKFAKTTVCTSLESSAVEFMKSSKFKKICSNCSSASIQYLNIQSPRAQSMLILF